MTEPSPPDPRTATAARRLGYSLLPGEGFSYLLLLRPREWPIMAAHIAVCYAVALAGGAEPQLGVGRAILGLVIFVVCLNGGALAVNSAVDADEGDIGYLDAPPPPPPHLLGFSIGLMLAGLLLAALAGLPRAYLALYAVAFFFALAYSLPPLRWKAVAGMDLAVNALGFGLTTTFAGWVLTGAPLRLWGAFLLGGFAPLFGALYPLTQLYQMDTDRARGDRTLSLALGARGALLVSVAAAALAFVLFAAGLRMVGSGSGWPLLLVAAAAWAWVLGPWLARAREMTAAEHKSAMYRALLAWAITDVAVLAAAWISAR